jgi:predicted glycogen debranching enzyme
MKTIFRPQPIIRDIPLVASDPEQRTKSQGPYAEWIITNGLGGYASGTVGGANTRRFHGWLVSALPAPRSRTMMVNSLREYFYIGQRRFSLGCEDIAEARTEDMSVGNSLAPDLLSPYLKQFRLEMGLPVWVFHMEDSILEKRVCMVHSQNTTCIVYTLLQGAGRIEVQPALHIRPHEGSVEGPPFSHYKFGTNTHGFELSISDDLPILRFSWHGDQSSFHTETEQISNLRYRLEQSRGYDWQGGLWSPGIFTAELTKTNDASLKLSTEDWDRVEALTSTQALSAEKERRRRLLHAAPDAAREGFAAELVLAADQFMITPIGRIADQVRANSIGDEVRSVIAGYHWFTDWGRDTMISLEGLTLCTGRWHEARSILRSFANYIRDGLIPNLFPEGEVKGLYHTADATLWLFHALDRYILYTADYETLEFILPKLVDVIHRHLRGTDFGIAVDPSDGLLSQGAIGYQLTWMDAKVDGWVVTPRRGKAVEINALWYNALRLTVEWLDVFSSKSEDRDRFAQQASLAYESFQRRFWNDKLNCLYDIVDSLEERDGRLLNLQNDSSIRPNQVMALALKYPAIDKNRWIAILDVVKNDLFTPVGLRSLSPRDSNYKPQYDGDLRTRDAAYHQGTVWAWLIGPFCNAWCRTYPDDLLSINTFLEGFEQHLSVAGVGTISEIFDAEAPYIPRGCIAQAWSVAEVLRCKLLVEDLSKQRNGDDRQ